VASLVLLSGVPAAEAQDDWSVSDPSARRREIIQRYRELIERDPADGPLVDRLVAELGGDSGVRRLAAEYAARSRRNPSDFAAAMIEGLLLSRLDPDAEAIEAALAAFRRAISIAPGSLAARLSLASLLRSTGQRDAAVSEYGQALVRAPDAGSRRRIHRIIADLAFDAHDWDAALRSLRQVADLSPGDATVRIELASVLSRHERYEDAASYLRDALRMPGVDPRTRIGVLRELGDTWTRARRYAEALGVLEQALELVDRGSWLERDLLGKQAAVHREVGDLADWISGLTRRWEAPDYDQLMFLASLNEDAGLFDAAARLLRRAIEQRPDTVDARAALAALLERLGDSAGLLEVLDQLVALTPGDASVGLRRAEALRRVGRNAASVAELRRVGALPEARGDTLVEVADRLERLGASAEARAVLERNVTARPREPEPLLALGSLLYAQGRRSEAERVWRRVLALGIPGDEAHALVAGAYADHGLVEDAVDELSVALGIAPARTDLRRTRARLLLRAGEPTEAEAEWRRLWSEATDAPLRREAREALIRLFAEQGRIEPLLADAERFEREVGVGPEALRFKAEALLHQERRDAAIETWRALLWERPGDVEALGDLARTLAQVGRLDEAIDAQRALAAADPTRRREAFWAISDMALRRFDDETASSFAEQAVELGPDDPAAQARWAALLRRLGRLGEAATALRRAWNQQPANPRVASSYSDVLVLTGRPGEAADVQFGLTRLSNDEADVADAGGRAIAAATAGEQLRRFVDAWAGRASEPRLGPAFARLALEGALAALTRQGSGGVPAEDPPGGPVTRAAAVVTRGGDSQGTELVLAILQLPRAPQSLVEWALRSPEPRLRTAALRSVVLAPPRSALLALLESVAAGESPPTDQVLAVWALAQMAGREAERALARAARQQGGHPDVTAWASAALALRGRRVEPGTEAIWARFLRCLTTGAEVPGFLVPSYPFELWSDPTPSGDAARAGRLGDADPVWRAAASAALASRGRVALSGCPVLGVVRVGATPAALPATSFGEAVTACESWLTLSGASMEPDPQARRAVRDRAAGGSLAGVEPLSEGPAGLRWTLWIGADGNGIPASDEDVRWWRAQTR
jgi:tetratricopeptide (TPR) repeat protein